MACYQVRRHVETIDSKNQTTAASPQNWVLHSVAFVNIVSLLTYYCKVQFRSACYCTPNVNSKPYLTLNFGKTS